MSMMTPLSVTGATTNFSPQQVLQKPLITGASVSADTGTMSPGKRLARRYTDTAEIKTVAFGGTPGREVTKSLRNQNLSDRSIIIAIDLFFWDSVAGSLKESLDSLEYVLGQAQSAGVPIVLGQIPELLPGRQLHREPLNRAIAKACANYSSCYLMPFDQLLRQVLRDGYLDVGGRRMSIPELIPDGLHLSDAAGEYLADLMLELLQKPKAH